MPLSALALTDDLFSLDAYVENIIENARDLLVLRVSKRTEGYPILTGGDVLIVEKCGAECRKCTDTTRMVFKYKDRYIISQRDMLGSLLRRSRLYVVGGTPSGCVEPVGRVIAWLHGGELV